MRECDVCGNKFSANGAGLSVKVRGIFGSGIDDNMVGSVAERGFRIASFDLCDACLEVVRINIAAGGLRMPASVMVTKLGTRDRKDTS